MFFSSIPNRSFRPCRFFFPSACRPQLPPPASLLLVGSTTPARLLLSGTDARCRPLIASQRAPPSPRLPSQLARVASSRQRAPPSARLSPTRVPVRRGSPIRRGSPSGFVLPTRAAVHSSPSWLSRPATSRRRAPPSAHLSSPVRLSVAARSSGSVSLTRALLQTARRAPSCPTPASLPPAAELC
jgi:hypothetical protein